MALNPNKSCVECAADCEIEEKPLAVVHCNECNLNYCEDCCARHKKRKSTKNHTWQEILNDVSNLKCIRSIISHTPSHSIIIFCLCAAVI